MKSRPHSGNSSFSVQEYSGTGAFVKRFSPSRPYQFYNELFISKYLRSFDKDFSANILAFSRAEHTITYELLSTAEYNEDCLIKYTQLISRIHAAATIVGSFDLTLFASQPLVSFDEFSITFLNRIKQLSLQKNIPHHVLNHIFLISNMHNELIKNLSGVYLRSPFVFSQADSGIHNCIVSNSGQLMLADLEYSGLDSPLKQCLDLLLHPKMQPVEFGQSTWLEYFLSSKVNSSDQLYLRPVASLLSLKWALIMLNEFRDSIWTLRCNSSPERAYRKDRILRAQYRKSEIYYNAACKLLDGQDLCSIFSSSEKSILSDPY